VKRLLVLGAGTAGTMVANRLHRRLRKLGWHITVADPSPVHRYQPGFLFLPFGGYTPEQVTKSTRAFLPRDVEIIPKAVDRVEPGESQVVFADDTVLHYDQLVIATGTTPRPDQTPGMDGDEWRRSVHEFYTFEGAVALRDKLRTWDGGRFVVHVTEMPIKCPVAPLEFMFLAEAFFRETGMRDRVEIVYATPLPGAFTKPVASKHLGGMLEERKIMVEPDFFVERVDTEKKAIVSYDEREVPFDLLVTVPLNMGADFVGRSGLGNELNYVPVDRQTFLAKGYDNIFAIGDAADLPTSKAGSVAHFSVDVFTENFLNHIAGRPMTDSFDGHANCFIETGDAKGLLIDFNYDTEPLHGKFPLPWVGPMTLLGESRANHWGKLAFRWVYWHVLLPGRPLPLPAHMSMAGKKPVTDD